jgi:catechol 2,3-dioxygenase
MSQAEALLPAATRLGTLSLTVHKRGELAAFYARALGLQAHDEGSSTALGFGGETLLRLVENPSAVDGGRHASMYHVCLAVERREDLGWWLRRLLDGGYELQGLVDHRMAEAIYLQDPEGNGIELNWDRPRSEWRPWSEWLAMGNGPLDTEGLLEANAQAGPRGSLPKSTRVGHVHLHVGDLGACEDFYCGALGLSKTVEIPGQAVFTAAGGYHHHIAFNVWKGRGVAPQPLGAYGLRSASLVLPKRADLDAVAARLGRAAYGIQATPEGLLTRDPSGHGLLLTATN